MNKLPVLFLSVCLAGLSWGVDAQTPRAYENAASAAFESQDYHSALKYYQKVLEMEPGRADILFRAADAARLFGAFVLAEKYYQQTLSLDFNGQYPKTTFGLATVKKHLGKYDEAIPLYQQYVNRPDADAALRQRAQQELEVCEWAMEKWTNPAPGVVVERMPDRFNSAESEFGITQRGDTLYFSTFKHLDWGDKHVPPRPLIQVVEAIDGREPGPATFNVKNRHTAHSAFSPDGNILIFNQCDYVGVTGFTCELYFSKRTPTGWTAPVKLPDHINVPNYTTTEPAISAREDGYFDLYYASDRPGGKGGKDIWQARFSAAGNFAQAENLSSINTPEDDITPFFDALHKTLYFSSLGYMALGGFDIYKSELKNGAWKTPENLGVPFNSSFNDLYYAPQTEDYAFLSSNRPGSMPLDDEACCNDLYKVRFLPLQLEALAFSKSTLAPLSGVIFTLEDLSQKMPVFSQYADTGNSATFDLKRDQGYVVIASKEGYLPDTVRLSTHTFPANLKFTEKLYLRPDIALVVKTYNGLDQTPLYGVNVRLYEMTGRIFGEKNTGTESNESPLPITFERTYRVIAEKEGFESDTVLVTDSELRSAEPGAHLVKKLFLAPATLNGLLPLTLYFDNDVPPRLEKYILPYDETYREYRARRNQFIEEFTAGMDVELKAIAAERLNQFFDLEVQGGFVKLENFAQNLDIFLENNYQIEIMVKGFASPLAKPEYNLALTRRRILSVLNYLRKYENNIYEGYILDGRLKVSTAPLGETASAPGVSDNARDRQRSVFSVEASKERRAEILEVRLTRKKR